MFESPNKTVKEPSKILKLFLLGVVLAFFSPFYIPWIPNFFYLAPSIDESWIIGLYHLFELKKQFGIDSVFSYGPYGFLIVPYYYPGTFPIVLSAYLLFFLIFAESAWLLLKKSTPSSFFLRLFLFSLILLVSCPPSDNFFLAGCFFAFLTLDSDKITLRSYLLAFTFALMSFIKFYFIFAVFPVFIWITIKSLKNRRIPWVTFFFILAYLTLWKLAGQKMSTFLPYFRTSWEVASGYVWAMGHPNFPKLGFFEFAYLFSALFLIGSMAWVRAKQSYLEAVKFTLLLGSFCFLVFKLSFILSGGYHAFVGFFFLAAIALLCFPELYPFFSSLPKKILLYAVIIFIASSISACYYYYKIDPWKDFVYTLSVLPDRIRLIRSHSLREIHESITQNYALQNPLPRVVGTSDIYSHRQLMLFANQLSYSPRPVYQSYTVHSGRLAEINANFLKSPLAPEYLFLAIDTWRKRFPAMDDGLSWPDIATKYFPIADIGSILVLKKASIARPSSLIPLSSLTVGWNETIPVPQLPSGKIWVRIKVVPTRMNHLLSLLYKPVSMQIWMQTNTEINEFSLVPSIAEKGFLLSPFIFTASSFGAVFYGNNSQFPQDLNVLKIKFTVAPGYSAEKYFDKKIEISFFALKT